MKKISYYKMLNQALLLRILPHGDFFVDGMGIMEGNLLS
jgi:hypothetical protein